MKKNMKKIIVTTFAIASISLSQAQVKKNTQVVTKSLNKITVKLNPDIVSPLIEKGFSVYLVKLGDLNNDSIEDLAVVYNDDMEKDAPEICPKRKIVLYSGVNNTTIKKIIESNSLASNPSDNTDCEYGTNIAIKNGFISIENSALYPSTEYLRIITFKYDPNKNDWIIHKDNYQEVDRKAAAKTPTISLLKEGKKGKSIAAYSIID